MSILRALRREGVLGLNRRNVEYTLRCNPRRHYPRVDNKLITKRLCEAAGIPVPGLIAVATQVFEIPRMIDALDGCPSFVVKPARGAMGNGILVVRDREADRFLCAGGRTISVKDLRYHVAGIVSGLYSLGGQPDEAVVEERLEVHPQLAEIATEGVPDIRVIVYRGFPVMAMVRLPTRCSGGRSNLHQGAIGAGIDLAEGRTIHAVLGSTPVALHPDTKCPVVGAAIPDFDQVLEIAVHAADQTELGYIGADVALDAARGPVILELNARPGLAIQIANRAGLLPRLRTVEQWQPERHPRAERIAMGRDLARWASGERAQLAGGWLDEPIVVGGELAGHVARGGFR